MDVLSDEMLWYRISPVGVSCSVVELSNVFRRCCRYHRSILFADRYCCLVSFLLATRHSLLCFRVTVVPLTSLIAFGTHTRRMLLFVFHSSRGQRIAFPVSSTHLFSGGFLRVLVSKGTSSAVCSFVVLVVLLPLFARMVSNEFRVVVFHAVRHNHAH